VTQHRFLSNLWVSLRLNVQEWVKFHIHAAHLPYLAYVNHDSDCDRFACQFLVRLFFGGCHFNFLYNIGGGLEKYYIVQHRVNPKIRFLRYTICERPLGLHTCHQAEMTSPPNYLRQFKLVLDLATPEGRKAVLTYLVGYIPTWYNRPKTITHPSINRARRMITPFIRRITLTTTVTFDIIAVLLIFSSKTRTQ